ncbi:LamG-like jellyroll fold domain-containing protein [Sphingomonas sp.]|jgi:hypothetical protein|uniref:LamG-like jellyroll fold domain-containing protein n=1 Tax=Sphingomonas sp. TaxID=28214 RepID=UPI002E3359FE|nr:LamG-like jellyroll fold domain-containing protein [Sphingomonas sp.]HEX4693738.1 LamG-like jellyroll fold domain-containing protein [Sphingomonas sp.]
MRRGIQLGMALLAIGVMWSTTSAHGRPDLARTGVRLAGSPTPAAPCLLATDFYKISPPALLEPIHLYTVDANTGAGTMPRTTTAPPFVDLAWGADGRLYGVSTFGSLLYPVNSVYRVDPITGATTLIGPTGLHGLGDGDLSTDPQTGLIYGINGARLYRFNGITSSGTTNPTATWLSTVNYPTQNSTWDFSGLAFDASGNLYALGQSQGYNAQHAHLLRINPATGAILADITLSRRFHGIGGLEFHNGKLYYGEGEEPGTPPASSNNLYSLWQIDPSTGVAAALGSMNIPGGVSSLVSCPSTPPPPCVPPPPDMDAWYPMDGTGNDLVLGNNAVASGGYTWPAGEVAASVRLANGYMSVAPGPVLNEGLGDFSIDTWINVNTGELAGIKSLFDKRIQNSSGVHGWAFFLYSGKLGVQLADGAYGNYLDNRTLSPGWHHIAVTVDRDNPQGIRFYIDGVPGAPQNPTAHQGNLDNPKPTLFGRNALDNSQTPSLQLDEVEFFDRVVGTSEVAAIFAAHAAGKCK